MQEETCGHFAVGVDWERGYAVGSQVRWARGEAVLEGVRVWEVRWVWGAGEVQAACRGVVGVAWGRGEAVSLFVTWWETVVRLGDQRDCGCIRVDAHRDLVKWRRYARPEGTGEDP
jgi:hypothetical protein